MYHNLYRYSLFGHVINYNSVNTLYIYIYICVVGDEYIQVICPFDHPQNDRKVNPYHSNLVIISYTNGV